MPDQELADYAARYGMLIGMRDRQRVLDRFGTLPTSPAVPMLPPPPPAVQAPLATVQELATHAAWRQEWEALRRKGIGASELPAIAGIPGAYGSPFAYWWDKKSGGIEEFDPTSDEILIMGTRLESVIGEVWQERNPDALLVRPGAGLYADPGYQWLMCTPDFLAVRAYHPEVGAKVYPPGAEVMPVVEPVECKAYDGGTGWGEPGTDQVPPHILCQVLVQCEVLGALRGHVARMSGKKVTLYTVERHPEDGRHQKALAGWLRAGQEFMDSLKGDTPPPIDAAEDTGRMLGFLHDMDEGQKAVVSRIVAGKFRRAQAALREAEAEMSLARNMMRAAMGTAQFAYDPDGQKVADRRVYKRREFIVGATVIDAIYPSGPAEVTAP